MVLAIITLAFSGHHHARQIVVSLFIMLWGARLSGFLLFRIIKTGKDDRFDDKRDKFFSFLGFWIFQMIWVGQPRWTYVAGLADRHTGLDGFITCHRS